MSANTTRTSRIEARISPDALEVVRRAAELQGRSVSDFVVVAAQEAAARTIQDAHIMRLSVEDQAAFADMILNSPAPNAALLKAAKSYRSKFVD
jgi:uncharacterized protein (DUF1778 family)